MSTHTTTPAPQTIELIRRLLEAAHRPEPANDPTICAICGAPLTRPCMRAASASTP